jgi:hypothetical protein
MKIDLGAVSIPMDQRVWRLFPGSGYQFLKEFQSQEVGFLDAPGFLMPPDGIKLSDAKDLIPRVALSHAIRDKKWGSGADANVSDLTLEKFQKARKSQGRTALANGLTSFLEVAKAGDIVMLPEPVRMSRVWVGRFVSNRTKSGYFPRWYDDVKIPARSIEWIASVEENKISTKLAQSLRHQHPFSLIEISLKVEAFSLAYGSFVYGDRHVATIYNDGADFLDSDAAFLSTVSRLASAASEAVENKTNITTSKLLDLLLANPNIVYTCTQEADIHSAGFLRYISGTPVSLVIAALVATLLVLSACSSKEEVASKLAAIEYVNSSTSNDPQCTARVSAASKQVLDVLGIERTWQLCEAARAASERARLRSTAKSSGK